MTSDAPHPYHRFLALALGIAALTAVGPGLAAGVYRWVDEGGDVHYGDRPPGKEGAMRIEIEAAPAPAPEDARRRAKTQRLLDALQSERNRQQAEAAQANADKARRERNCQAARRRVALYQRANNVSRRGSDGERVYLSDEERAQALAQARTIVGQWCR